MAPGNRQSDRKIGILSKLGITIRYNARSVQGPKGKVANLDSMLALRSNSRELVKDLMMSQGHTHPFFRCRVFVP